MAVRDSTSGVHSAGVFWFRELGVAHNSYMTRCGNSQRLGPAVLQQFSRIPNATISAHKWSLHDDLTGALNGPSLSSANLVMSRDISLCHTALVAGLAFALTPVVWRMLHRKKLPANSLSNVPGPSDASFFEGEFNEAKLPMIRGTIIEAYASAMGKLAESKESLELVPADQYSYEEASFFTSNNHVIFGPGLLSVTGEHHRKQRKMLNPVFSVAHLRHMVPTFFEIADQEPPQLRHTFLRKVSNGDQEIDIVAWMTRAALEIVGQSGFGTSFAPVTDDAPEHPYAHSVKELGPLLTVTAIARMFILPPVQKYRIGGHWLQRKVVDILPWKAGRQMRDIVDTMHKTSVNIFEGKRKALSQEGDSADQERKKDIISILMEENMKSSTEDRLSDEEVIAQMSTLMFAAMDTTSSALARILHLLSINQNVQDKLRAELRDAYESYGANPNHDELVNLPYLDAVCRETLRLYPPVATITRETQADIFLPLSKPMKGVDGSEMSEIFLPKNSNVFISIRGSNTDPTVWGDKSYEWVPERWLESLPQSVRDAHVPGVYSHLMTFIGGGRACIGFKFSQLEMKVILYTLVRQFRFAPPKEDIYWQMTFIASPTVDPRLKDLRPRMPLTVSLISDA
ncbi:hypothetical protein NMY22_g11558 [Coprinellus aureogranulatus]|nr:hypothetical protein NMY22_g11558 [Coprinellus aureogranulatus]